MIVGNIIESSSVLVRGCIVAGPGYSEVVDGYLGVQNGQIHAATGSFSSAVEVSAYLRFQSVKDRHGNIYEVPRVPPYVLKEEIPVYFACLAMDLLNWNIADLKQIFGKIE